MTRQEFDATYALADKISAAAIEFDYEHGCFVATSYSRRAASSAANAVAQWLGNHGIRNAEVEVSADEYRVYVPCGELEDGEYFWPLGKDADAWDAEVARLESATANARVAYGP